MVASMGHSCDKFADLLSWYMACKVYGPCPDDWSLSQSGLGCRKFECLSKKKLSEWRN
uniref:Uncharacterized protein n=1 Tax=Populus trichocarpa TaxID=3694 RepID=B9HVM0_POPTR